MARSSFKKNYIAPSIWKKIIKLKLNKVVGGRLIFNRGSTVPTILSGSSYFVYNGTVFNKVAVGELNSNKKFGEFSTSKKPFFYPKKTKSKR